MPKKRKLSKRQIACRIVNGKPEFWEVQRGCSQLIKLVFTRTDLVTSDGFDFETIASALRSQGYTRTINDEKQVFSGPPLLAEGGSSGAPCGEVKRLWMATITRSR